VCLRNARLPEGRDNNGKELWKFKTPSGIIGNVHLPVKGKQYVGTFSGIGWAGIAGCRPGEGPDGPGAVGGYKELRDYTDLSQLTIFTPPKRRTASATHRPHPGTAVPVFPANGKRAGDVGNL
jgi:hypothetical protein